MKCEKCGKDGARRIAHEFRKNGDNAHTYSCGYCGHAFKVIVRQVIKRRYLEMFDNEHGDSTIRELEMEADAVITSPGYGVQFWRDVQLYGVDEAILYVRNGNHGDADKLAAAWDRIRARIVPQAAG